MSEPDPGAPLLEQKLMFFGRISASLSHELKNVLATINEFSGLLDDLSRAAASGRPLKPERLQSVCGKIANQIGRGEELIRRMNRFSHSVDEPLASVDLRELLGLVCDLCGRFAKLKQATLERRFPDAPQVLTLDTFALEYAVALAIDLALRGATDERRVTVALLEPAAPRGCQIAVESADPLGPAELARTPEHALLVGVMAHLGGTVDLAPERIVLGLGA